MRNKYIILFVILTLISCGGKRRVDLPDPFPPATRIDDVQGFQIIARGEFTDNEWARVLYAVDYQIKAYTTDVHPPGRTNIYVLHEETFEFQGIQNLLGITIIGQKNYGYIAVVNGLNENVPALYHEFCHWDARSTLYGHDPDHADPAWTDWASKQAQLNSEILIGLP